MDVHSSNRYKSLWSATGPTCHSALYSAEVPRGRSSLSVLKEGSMGKEERVMVSDFSFFSTSLGLSSCSHDFTSDFFRCLFQSSFPSQHHTSQPATLSLLQIPVSAWMKHAPVFLPDSSHSPVLLTSSFSLPCSFKSGEHFWPFPFFLLARIQKYYLSCDVFSSAIFKSLRLPM